MTALPAEATRQLRATWPLRYSALATDQSYGVPKMESGDVGCVATSAQRHSAGSVPGMTALVEGTRQHRAPKGRNCLPPSRQLIKPLRSTINMPNRSLALVERAQAAINNIAIQLALSKGYAGIRYADQPFRVSAVLEFRRIAI